ncbi:MAG: hypothetical protein A2Z29_00335 [Chloroflexi bacterium RBG_16_56_11]|nr:MAG: hypothetical protein A2Z29_00335 [Chloroflexi bacterium RBG_16_56_11]
MDEIVYLNGSLVPRSGACLSVDDHGFLYGYALFETMRAYNGRIFLLDRHLTRLVDTAETIGLTPGLAGIDLAQACDETIKANHLREARVRLTVTNGDAEVLPWAESRGRCTVVVTARPYTPFPADVYRQGFKVGVASLRRSAGSPMSRIKSTNYLVNVLARTEAARRGLDEALLLNDRGFIAEGGNSNIFFVVGPRLVTPSLENGILPGVTRQVVMELAEKLDIKVIEGNIRLSDLARFREAFITSSVVEIMPLVGVEMETKRLMTIGDGKPGNLTMKLQEAYRAKVREETGY